MLDFRFRHDRHCRHEECSDRDLLLLIILELEEIEAKIDALLPPPPPPDLVSGTLTLGESMSDISVPAGTLSEKAVATFVDANGNSGVPASPPVWAVDDSTLASVTADPADATGQTADVSLVDTDSGVVVNVTATATNADGSVAVAAGSITVEAAIPPPPVDLVSGDVAFSSGP